MEGNWRERDYSIVSPRLGLVAAVGRVMLQMAETYAIEVPDADNALCVLMAVLAIDAAKC